MLLALAATGSRWAEHIVSWIHIAADVDRMGALAVRVAKIATGIAARKRRADATDLRPHARDQWPQPDGSEGR